MIARLLGFDARENEIESRKIPISPSVRESFFLRPEIEFPFSVDKSV
jgi:hypothetical protein